MADCTRPAAAATAAAAEAAATTTAATTATTTTTTRAPESGFRRTLIPIMTVVNDPAMGRQLAIALSIAWSPKYVLANTLDSLGRDDLEQGLAACRPAMPQAIIIGGSFAGEVVESVSDILARFHVVAIPPGSLYDSEKGLRWIAQYVREELDKLFPSPDDGRETDGSDSETGIWRLRQERKWQEA